MMNWRRGLVRLWLVGSVVWIALGLHLFSDGFTAMHEVEVEPVEFVCQPSPCPSSIANKYDCRYYGAVYQQRSCTYARVSYLVSDQRARTWAFVGLIAPPIAVPLLGFVVSGQDGWLS
jgi:hypothetical protein